MPASDSLQKDVDKLKRTDQLLDARLKVIEKALNITPVQEGGKQPQKASSFEADVGLKWFSRIGILALVIGVGYFIKYALDKNWITHFTQIIIGVLIGVVLITIGQIVSKKEKYVVWAQTLMGGGFAIVYFAVYAAYHFESYRNAIGISQTADIVLLTITVLATITMSLLHDSKAIFCAAFFLGFITSLLSATFQSLTLIYCLILTLGLVFVVLYKQWPEIGIAGVAATYVTFFLWKTSTWIHKTKYGFGLTATFLIIYFVVYTIQSLLLKQRDKEDNSDAIVSVMNHVLFFGLFFMEVEKFYPKQSWIWAFSIAIASFVIMFIGSRLQKERISAVNSYATIFYLATSVYFYFIQSGLKYKNFWITIAWAVLAAIILTSGFWFNKKHIRIQGIMLFGVVILKVFLYDVRELETAYRTIAFIVLGVILLATSFIYNKYKERLKELF